MPGRFRFRCLLLAGCAGLVLSWAPCVFAADEGPPPYPAPVLDPGALTPDEMNLLDAALSTILLDRSDLNFKKDYMDDPFRLAVVQRALLTPLSLVDWTYGWDAFLLTPKSPADIIRRAAADLDCAGSTSNPAPAPGALGAVPGLPKEWLDPLGKLDGAVASASHAMEAEVLAGLTPDDRLYLKTYLLCRFTENEKERAGLHCPVEEAYGADPRFLDIMKRFNRGALLRTAADLSDAVDAAAAELASLPPPARDAGTVRIQGASGVILVGTPGDDGWNIAGPPYPSIVIDPAGNDLYQGSVAAAGSLGNDDFPLVSVVMDLTGDDTYQSGARRSCGSGVMGIAILLDIAGDDTYRSGRYSQGCGVFGVGILEDRAGDDVYRADLLVQGAGAIGLGLLSDAAGRDSYHGAFYAQGFGFTLGWGMLTDRDGYDAYYAGGRYDSWPTWGSFILSCSQGYAFGIRPVASGGIGILHDRNGKDHYSAEVFSQGGSYWFGIGAMIDDNDDDQYAAQVYSQGAGVHLSTGIILDRAGNDSYTCDNQAQGFAHDYSVGWLIDEGGNDSYSAKANAQGCAVTNSVAGLIDRAGDDGYLCRDAAKGASYGGVSRGFGNMGVQLDMDGKDTYSVPDARDGGWWTLQSWYAGIDVGENWWKVVKDARGKETGRSLMIPGFDDAKGVGQ